MCPSPESSDTMGGPKCGTSTIFMQGYYAVGITGIAILLVPMIRRSSSTISAMGVTIRSMGDGGNHLLIGGGQVKERIKYQALYSQKPKLCRVLCYAMLCHAMPCYAWWCSAMHMPCYAMPSGMRCIVPHCAALLS